MHAIVNNRPNPLRQLSKKGQSVWLDYIRRNLITSGTLDHLIEQDGLRGMTSNPAIFEKVVTGCSDYAKDLDALRSRHDLDEAAIFERITIADIRRAADHFESIYRGTQQRDGYVSMEVSPRLAADTAGTVADARRLWHTVDRPNLLIKVPATPEGLPAIETLLKEGINVNVTLLFSVDVYTRVAEAYFRALEFRDDTGADLSCIATVASFFVSRVDTAIDRLIDRQINQHSLTDAAEIAALKGRIAIANARIAYKQYQSLFSGKRWQRLARAGALPQRLLWASTGTKNPAYRDVRYVEELIGRDTVNTLPPATLDAFRNHGKVRESLTESVEESARLLALLAHHGIILGEVTDRLLTEGVAAFTNAYDKALAAIQ
jgi:transaldolase